MLIGQKTQYWTYVNYPRLMIYRFDANLIKIPKGFSGGAEINKRTLKSTWKCKKPRITKNIEGKGKFRNLYYLISSFIKRY